MTRTYAPAPAADPAFDRIMESVHEAMAADPDASKYSEPARREVIARALATHGKRTFATANEPYPFPDDRPDDEPASQAVQGIELTIPPGTPEPYWYEDPADAKMIEHYILSRVALGARLPGGLLITGPAGSGKTLGVVRAVERLNAAHPDLALPLLVMNCPTLTDPAKWFGRREIDDAGSRYETSDFVDHVRSGAVILLDEFMRLHPTIHNPVMSLLDGTESVLLSDLNLTITRHPRTVFIGTTNVGAQFGGTHRMDWAMRERWSYTVERDYPPRDEEIRILVAHNPGCDPDAASVLVDIAEKSRGLWQTGDIKAPISTRTLDNAAYLVASGMAERRALHYTALPEYDAGAEGVLGAESERTKVLGIIEGKTVR